MKKIIICLAIFLGVATSCQGSDKAVFEDEKTADETLNRMNDSQSVPKFSWSQRIRTGMKW